MAAKRLTPRTWYRYDKNGRLIGIRHADGSEVAPELIRQMNEANDERRRKIEAGELPHPGPFQVRFLRYVDPDEDDEDEDEE